MKENIYIDETIQSLMTEMFTMQAKAKLFVELITKDDQLSQNQVMLLIQLKLEGTMKVTEVSDFFRVTPGAATTMCDKLENHDLLARVRAKEDRRIVRVVLTPKGERKVKGVFQRFSKQKLQQINHVFKEVNSLMASVIE